MAHIEHIRVAYIDVDMMGHVNNAAYFTYCETARCNYYLALSGLTEILKLDIIVAKQVCEYRRGLRFGEDIEVVVWPTHIGTTSFTLGYLLRTTGGETVATAETVIVAFDYAKNQKKPIDAGLRTRLESELKGGPGGASPG